MQPLALKLKMHFVNEVIKTSIAMNRKNCSGAGGLAAANLKKHENKRSKLE
jgi:hypothetical protein